VSQYRHYPVRIAVGIGLNLQALLLDYMEGYVVPIADKHTDNHKMAVALVVLHMSN
jgi:hypothetical protein